MGAAALDPRLREDDEGGAIHRQWHLYGDRNKQTQPGSYIPAHLHEGVAEVLYVVEGEFINEGKRYAPGTSLHVKAGQLHGPRSTTTGCTLIVLWTDRAATQDANLADFNPPQISTCHPDLDDTLE